MKSLNVEILMGHDIGLANSYYKPSQQELLEDYLKSIDLLTIQDNKSKLEKQIKELKEKTDESTYEREAELLEWKKRYLNDVKGLIKQINSMKKFRKETQDELAELKKYRLNHMKMALDPYQTSTSFTLNHRRKQHTK